MVEQCNSDYGTEERLWWNSGKEMVEQRNRGTEMVEQWNNDGGTEEQRWWYSGTMMVEQWKRYGGRVQQ